jgi:hypothetical protein
MRAVRYVGSSVDDAVGTLLFIDRRRGKQSDLRCLGAFRLGIVQEAFFQPGPRFSSTLA